MKTKRQELIRELVTKRHIATQEELTALLMEMGEKVTQATVSRDMKELMLAKAPDGRGGYYYVCPDTRSQGADMRHIGGVRGSIQSVSSNDYLVVIHTLPGAANLVAFTLDAAKWEEIIGTLAGDDTVFLALRTPRDRAAVLKKLGELGK